MMPFTKTFFTLKIQYTFSDCHSKHYVLLKKYRSPFPGATAELCSNLLYLHNTTLYLFDKELLYLHNYLVLLIIIIIRQGCDPRFYKIG